MKIIKQVDQIGWAAIGKEYAKLRDMHKKLEHDQTEAKKKEVDMQMAEQLRHIKAWSLCWTGL